MYNFKVGDRVYFQYSGVPDSCGYGVISAVYDTFEAFDVIKDGEEQPYFVEFRFNDFMIPEKVYNSKLYKALK